MRKNITNVISCLALLALILLPQVARAQYVGAISQLTTTQSFQEVMQATPTHVAVNNIAQAGHSLTVQTTGAGTPCVVTLDGSQDGTNWYIIATVLSRGGIVVPFAASANGYFPQLRITLNLESNAGCAALDATIRYVGYQFPVTPAGVPEAGTNTNQAITSPVTLLGGSPLVAPWTLLTMTCTNPGASIAYVEIWDSATTPTLGVGPLWEFGVAAGSSINFFPPQQTWVGPNAGWIGAATTPSGSTPVSTGVVCSYSQSNQFAVWPFLISSP